ncbi:MAG: calcium/sodium antiporter [Candidatus Enteromonas sp.]|nr:calcium/sodium antiporter [Candidatus Enteromonas sp.]
MIPDLNMTNWWAWLVCVACLAVGVLMLWKCSDIFVDGAASIAKKLKVSTMIIGLTVVAFGTSCPELAVSVSDSISCLIAGGNANVAIGNVVGSNICNILVVLGISAVFTPIVVKKSTLKKELPIMLGATALCVLFVLLFDTSTGEHAVLRWEGIILVVGIIAYVSYLVLSARNQAKKGLNLETENDEIKDMSTPKAILFTIFGLIGVIVGGEAVVYGAKNAATGIGTAAGLNPDLVESLVGLTIVAVGTSLPELIVSANAARHGQNDIALGNVIGSNIFNILFVLGIASTVNPLTVGNQIWVDLVVMSAASVLLLVFGLTGKIKKWGGWTFLACYAGYLAYLVTRTLIS